MSDERMDRREFLAKVLGLTGVAAVSLAAPGCGGEEDEEEDDD